MVLDRLHNLMLYFIRRLRGGNKMAKDIKNIKTKEEARQAAIDWQHKQANKSLSYGELAEYAGQFRNLGKRFGLLREFKENGIL